jgi:hypothetical protein
VKVFVALARKDLRVVYRDRFMLFVAGYALILAVVARFGAPWVPIAHVDLYLAPAIVMFGTLLLGTLLGFTLVEEREQGTWLLLRVLPMSSTSVFVYLATTAGVLAGAVGFAAAVLYGYPIPDWPAFVFMLAASASAAPLVMLVIGALAKNKIEGLAVSKIVSAVGLLPLAIFFVPMPWQLAATWCPLYWIYLGLLRAYASDTRVLESLYWPGFSVWLAGAMTIGLSLAGMALMVRRYTRAAS